MFPFGLQAGHLPAPQGPSTIAWQDTKRTTEGRRKSTKSTKSDTNSVVRSEYRARYGSEGHCGDRVAHRLKKLDSDGLREVAEANGVWKAEYAKLNPGLQRMSIGNRIRGLIRNGSKISWVGKA